VRQVAGVVVGDSDRQWMALGHRAPSSGRVMKIV
jgi:hypothetical protein